jgi:hypothetical protein
MGNQGDDDKPEEPGPRSSGHDSAKHHPLRGALRGLARVAPGADHTEPADPSWGGRGEAQGVGEE